MKHRKKNNFCFVVSLIFCVVALQSVDARYTADFLTLGVGARALAMGGAGTALSDNAYAPYWNPCWIGATHSI